MQVERFHGDDHAPYAADARYAGRISGAVRAGDRLFISAQVAIDETGQVHGLGAAGAQADFIMRDLRALLAQAGASINDVCKVTTALVDRAHRKEVYEAVGKHLMGVYPCGTGLVVNGLARPELLVQIDIEAAVPAARVTDGTSHQRLRKFVLSEWFGQQIAWQACMAVRADNEVFLRGQTGATLDGSRMGGLGRRPEDAGEQADLALGNLVTLLGEAGAAREDVVKLTVYVNDRAYRESVYPMIGKHLAGVHPVSTGIVMNAFARPEILFEIDAVVIPSRGTPHRRLRKYHSRAARYGLAGQQLDCEFCMAVRAGNTVILRGQTGVDLEERMQGLGDAAAQTEQAMRNVRTLLEEAGARLEDVVKATLYVTDRAFLAPAAAVVTRHLAGAQPAFSQMIVKGLASPELLVEVDITAVIPEDRA
jgi:enamine deaminase RidA (YjgF/YER057c/UK114 family)